MSAARIRRRWKRFRSTATPAGDMDLALERVRRAISMHPGWGDLLGRLPRAVLPAAGSVADALSEQS